MQFLRFMDILDSYHKGQAVCEVKGLLYHWPKANSKRIVSIELSKLKPAAFRQRQNIPEYELYALAESIRAGGMLHPLTVRRAGEQYQIIAGQRRFMALQLLGAKTADCILQELDDASAAILALTENLQRSDLSFFEQARAIEHILTAYPVAPHELAAKLGMAESTLSNKRRLLQLSDSQAGRITAAGLTERHARALVRLPDDRREEGLDAVIAGSLTVKQTEELVEQMLLPKPDAQKPRHAISIGDIRLFSNSLNRMIDTMRKAGFGASAVKNETEEYIEYTVRIPKTPRIKPVKQAQ